MTLSSPQQFIFLAENNLKQLTNAITGDLMGQCGGVFAKIIENHCL